MSTPIVRPNRLSSSIRPSATLAIAAKARKIKSSGTRVFDFSAGEPDFSPPTPVTEHVRAQLAAGPVHYAPVPGLPELRQAVATELGRVHQRRIDPEAILVSNGAKHSLANLFAVTLEPGDEVIVLAPYWVSYPDMITLAGGRSVIVETHARDGFRPVKDDVLAAITPRTRAVILNSPSNPTGVGLRQAELVALARAVSERAPDAFFVTDDIYRTLVYDGYETPSLLAAAPDLADRVVVVDGLSKSHAMTGYRVGFLWADPAVIRAAAAVQGQTTSGAATPTQWAALAALTDPACAPELLAMREAFSARRRSILDLLGRIEGTELVPPDGAFYVFIGLQEHIRRGRFEDDVALAAWLLEQRQVATVPGTAFGAPGHLRLSFATATEVIEEGVGRMIDALAALPGG